MITSFTDTIKEMLKVIPKIKFKESTITPISKKKKMSNSSIKKLKDLIKLLKMPKEKLSKKEKEASNNLKLNPNKLPNNFLVTMLNLKN